MFARACIISIFVLPGALLAEVPVNLSHVIAETSQLRSAYLGPSRWGQENLSAEQIDQQLKLHFQSVLRILKSQTESSLALAVTRLEQHYGLQLSDVDRAWVHQYLAAKRDWQLRTLNQYADRGQFPRNEGYAATAVPVFLDHHGTHCAVGYLMHRSGHDDKVAEIVQQNNLVCVNDVKQGTLVDWIIASGLTQAEAALIQPGYEPPPFQALLSDFQTPGFSLSMYGLTISDLTVMEYSYDGGDNIDQAFDTGFNQIFSLGSDYDRPDEFGITIGQGTYVYEPIPKIFYDPQLSHWVFLGGATETLGNPDPGDNSLMHWINYKIQADSGFFSEFGVTSTPFFNANFVSPDGTLRVTTQILTPDMMLRSQGTIQTDPGDPIPFLLSGSAFMEGNGTEFWVSTYALGYTAPGSFNAAHFTSIFNEVQLVPEPSSFAVSFVLVCLTSFARKRRR
jgi:hypothetical protein